MREASSVLPLLALGLLIVAPGAQADPTLPWCPDPEPDDEGFYPCPCPPCMAPCAFPADPHGECKGTDGVSSESTFACCCCGGSVGYSFRFFAPVLKLQSLGNHSLLTWTDVPNATAYDVVSGDLDSLRAGSGDFSRATENCSDDDNQGTSLFVDASPEPGEGIWFLIRTEVDGSYDAPSGSQMTSRDQAIAASGNDCS